MEGGREGMWREGGREGVCGDVEGGREGVCGDGMWREGGREGGRGCGGVEGGREGVCGDVEGGREVGDVRMWMWRDGGRGYVATVDLTVESSTIQPPLNASTLCSLLQASWGRGGERLFIVTRKTSVNSNRLYIYIYT